VRVRLPALVMFASDYKWAIPYLPAARAFGVSICDDLPIRESRQPAGSFNSIAAAMRAYVSMVGLLRPRSIRLISVWAIPERSIYAAGWIDDQIREQLTFTPGRIIVAGGKVKRGKPKRVDYLLSYKRDLPLAVVEAKAEDHLPGDGLQQAKD
jgi:hypothetical protein